jgi:hypothetical protein
MPFPTIPDAWRASPNRNHSIVFNYTWDEENQYWRAEQKGEGGSYSDYISANFDSYINKFGSNPLVGSSVSEENPTTVWDGNNDDLYTFPPDVATGIQLSSSENADNQELIVQGLDENFYEQYWTGNINGTGIVDIDGSWSRVFRAFNNDSVDLSGDVTIHPSGDDSIAYAKILSSNNQTLMAIYTIPADTTGYLMDYQMTANNPSSSSAIGYTLKLKTREFGKVFRTKGKDSVGTTYSLNKHLTFPTPLPPKTDIKFDIVAANGNNGSVNVDFEIALFK